MLLVGIDPDLVDISEIAQRLVCALGKIERARLFDRGAHGLVRIIEAEPVIALQRSKQLALAGREVLAFFDQALGLGRLLALIVELAHLADKIRVRCRGSIFGCDGFILGNIVAVAVALCAFASPDMRAIKLIEVMRRAVPGLDRLGDARIVLRGFRQHLAGLHRLALDHIGDRRAGDSLARPRRQIGQHFGRMQRRRNVGRISKPFRVFVGHAGRPRHVRSAANDIAGADAGDIVGVDAAGLERVLRQMHAGAAELLDDVGRMRIPGERPSLQILDRAGERFATNAGQEIARGTKTAVRGRAHAGGQHHRLQRVRKRVILTVLCVQPPIGGNECGAAQGSLSGADSSAQGGPCGDTIARARQEHTVSRPRPARELRTRPH